MGQQVFKNENFYIDETKSNYIEQLQTMYQKDIVVPEMKYKEFLEKLYESADLTEILPEEYQTSEEGADEKSQKKVSETQAVEVEEIRIE